MNRDMVAPLWQGVTLIAGRSNEGRVGPDRDLTAILLHAVKLLRADGFHKQQIQIP